MEFIDDFILEAVRIDDNAVLGIGYGDGLLVVLDIGIGILGILVVSIMHVREDLVQFFSVDADGQRDILAVVKSRRYIGHALPGQAAAADEMELIVDIAAVEFGIEVVEIERHIDAVRCQAQLLAARILFMFIEIDGNIILAHALQGLAVQCHGVFGLALGDKKAAETKDHYRQKGCAPLLPGLRLLHRQPVLLPIAPAILFHSLFTCFLFFRHDITCLFVYSLAELFYYLHFRGGRPIRSAPTNGRSTGISRHPCPGARLCRGGCGAVR